MKRLEDRVIQIRKTPLTRALFFVLLDIPLLGLSVVLSYLLRFGGSVPEEYAPTLLPVAVLFLAVKLVSFGAFRIYRMSWSYFGMYEMWNIVKALGFSFLALTGTSFVLRHLSLFHTLPRSIFFMDFFLSLFFISGLRISKRLYLHHLRADGRSGLKRTLIVGAGNAGEQIVRDMRRDSESGYLPVGFVDDDPHKRNLYIHGVKVHGTRKNIPDLVNKLGVDVVLIAMPSAQSKDIRDILAHVRESGVIEVRTIPGLDQILGGHVSLSDIKRVRIEDILGRDQVVVHDTLIRERLRGKSILVTGAGGSIGSELVRQVATYEPAILVALDVDETELFHIEQEILKSGTGVSFCPVVGDIRDMAKMSWVFATYSPQVVFHAAAYKHVPIMERYPEEAVKTNVLGTRNVARLAMECGTERFVMVSTDKAVRPTNVMGATKRVAEKLVREMNGRGTTRFVSVRFGNVVGSRGSVIPTFQDQIRQGGPVTVTHEDMTRYFMSIPEAVSLILQAGVMGEGGEVFVLDMGDPVRIVDIAREMIRLHGLEPDVDIPIVFSGMRPGEKLFEELMTSTEEMELTLHPKIYKVSDQGPVAGLMVKIPLFDDLVDNPDPDTIRAFLKELVEGYSPDVLDPSVSPRPFRPPSAA